MPAGSAVRRRGLRDQPPPGPRRAPGARWCRSRRSLSRHGRSRAGRQLRRHPRFRRGRNSSGTCGASEQDEDRHGVEEHRARGQRRWTGRAVPPQDVGSWTCRSTAVLSSSRSTSGVMAASGSRLGPRSSRPPSAADGSAGSRTNSAFLGSSGGRRASGRPGLVHGFPRPRAACFRAARCRGRHPSRRLRPGRPVFRRHPARSPQGCCAAGVDDAGGMRIAAPVETGAEWHGPTSSVRGRLARAGRWCGLLTGWRSGWPALAHRPVVRGDLPAPGVRLVSAWPSGGARSRPSREVLGRPDSAPLRGSAPDSPEVHQ